MNPVKFQTSFILVFLISSLLLSGCVDEKPTADEELLVIDQVSVETRSGYSDDFFIDSVVELTAVVTNKDVSPGSKTLQLRIDDMVVDEQTVTVNASEDKTVKLTNVELSESDFPLIIKGLNSSGLHSVCVNEVCTNITVLDPPLDVSVKSVEWKKDDEGWQPFITLRLRNNFDSYFYLGDSFGLVVDDTVFQGSVESWEIIVGDRNRSGFYPLPADAVADVLITSFDVVSMDGDGSDVNLTGVRVYAGLPWMDATCGIIGETKI